MTEQLYFTNSYLTEFEATITEEITYDQYLAVILNQTAFYPTGGGQPHDIGLLNDIAVINVVKEEGRILHLIDQQLPNERVFGQIDWTRRFDLMQQHSGQHILSQAILQTTEAATIGFHLSGDYATIDISRADLSDDDLFSAETLANQIIYENRPITARFVSTEELPTIPLRKQPNVSGPIRVITIADFDWSACGGTHVSQTGEVGVVKVIKQEQKKGGMRLTFLCGARALRHYHQVNGQIRAVARQLSTATDDVVEGVGQQLAVAKQARKDSEKIGQQLLAYEAKSLKEKAINVAGKSVISQAFDDKSVDEVRQMARYLINDNSNGDLIVLFGVKAQKGQLIFARSVNVDLHMPVLLQVAGKIIGGSGGGTPDMAQGGGPHSEKVPEALTAAIHWLAENV